MNRFLLLLSLPILLTLFLTPLIAQAEPLPVPNIIEMRTYTAAPGKLDDLHTRFREHTTGIFLKHEMVNLGYFVPEKNPDNQLIYFLGYQSVEARRIAWEGFRNDPEWKAAAAASKENGKLVAKVESLMLKSADFSVSSSLPEPESARHPRLYELREYTTNPDKLDTLDSRFRDHTVALFKRHGIKNLFYAHPTEDQDSSTNTLIYLIAHENKLTRKSSFKSFSDDPEWHEAKTLSEAKGPLLIEGGIKSTLLIPTDYSALR